MAGKRYLLDCTLRDGGYINDWAFGHDHIVNIFERVIASGVDVIEIGFLDERRVFDPDRSIMPDTQSVRKIYGGLDRKQAAVVGMIDFGTCGISHVEDCRDSWLDGIRVIFKKEKLRPAMAFCGQLKDKGYKVFAQLVSVTAYNDDELREAAALANEIRPFALSMVDTYGLLDPEGLTHIMRILDDSLDPDIILGFHAHNNFQLGYINATTALNYPTERAVLVDGTLYGMGKSAGNAPLELVAMYMNRHLGKDYRISEMQEAITSSVMDFQRKSPWGYQLFYYIAAANKVHPNYVSWLMNKRTLSITAINEILQKLPEDQKLEKNMKLIERLYLDYQKQECDDEAAVEKLAREIGQKPVLVIGPGASLRTHARRVEKFAEEEKPTVISINYIPEFIHPDYMFITNSTRFVQSATKLLKAENRDIRLIAASNLARVDRDFDYVINYSALIDEAAEFPDNSMCMLIRLLIRCGCKEAVLAGFDGYTPDNVNYFDVDKAYSFLTEKADSLNDYARRFFRETAGRITVTFLTPTEYRKGSEQ